MNRFVFLLFLFFAVPVRATDYTVTQSGAGADFGASTFNALSGTGYAGDTFYFSGTFTTRITVKISGTSGAPVTLDGYQTGECEPLVSICSASALLQYGMKVDCTSPINYLTVQDFRFTHLGSGSDAAVGAYGGIYPNTINDIHYFIFRRNWINDTSAAGMYFGHSYSGLANSHLIIENNKFTDMQMRHTAGESSVFSLVQAEHVLVRNNVFGHNNPTSANCPTGCNVVAWHSSDDILFEYNEVYGVPNQFGMAVKEKPGDTQNRHVYRFNKFYDNLNLAWPNSNEGGGLSFGTEEGHGTNYMYVYGNYMYNNAGRGLQVHRDFSYVYAWSNIMSHNGQHGAISWGDEGTGDHYILYNNTIAYNGNNMDLEPNWPHRGGIVVYWGINHIAKNNLLYNNRVSGALGQYHQIYDTTGMELDYNTLHHDSGNATWYYAGENRSLSTMRNTFGMEASGKVEDPLFTDPSGADDILGTADDDYTLRAGSPAISDGADLSQCFTQAVDLSGGSSWMEANSGYGRYIEPCLEDGLDPVNTDWTTTPPTVATVKRGTSGAQWGRGAYVFLESDTAAPASPINLRVAP